MTKERPILFSDEMVRAILDGRKTQTRRMIKSDVGHVGYRGPSRYGKTGDRLWVREKWAVPHGFDHLPPRLIKSDRIHYGATEEPGGLRWRASIHMPRWASRILLEITDVRIQRLQDITEKDAEAEGVKNSLHLHGGRFAVENFAHLWEILHGDDSWHKNPFVWVISFKRIDA